MQIALCAILSDFGKFSGFFSFLLLFSSSFAFFHMHFNKCNYTYARVTSRKKFCASLDNFGPHPVSGKMEILTFGRKLQFLAFDRKIAIFGIWQKWHFLAFDRKW